MSKIHEVTFSPVGEAFTSTKNGDHARSILKLGERVPLADNLWLVVGEMPQDNIKHPDIANALVYRAGDRLYLLDSGAGPTIRTSILQILQEIGPVQSFSLLNSHAHVDHIANNDLIHLVQARETHHYLTEAGLAQLDPFSYFAGQFAQLGAYHDVMKGFQAHRVLMRFVGVLRDVLAVFVGERRALQMLFHIMLRNFQPIRVSRETIQPYESLPKQPLVIGGVSWTGWVLGDNDVWVLEERGLGAGYRGSNCLAIHFKGQGDDVLHPPGNDERPVFVFGWFIHVFEHDGGRAPSGFRNVRKGAAIAPGIYPALVHRSYPNEGGSIESGGFLHNHRDVLSREIPWFPGPHLYKRKRAHE